MGVYEACTGIVNGRGVSKIPDKTISYMRMKYWREWLCVEHPSSV